VCDTIAAAKDSEVRWIAQRKTSAPAGYNATLGGEGVVPSDDLRAKMRAAYTPERRQRTAEVTAARNIGNTYGRANRGKTHTAETRAKIGAAHVGSAHHAVPHSAESKARMSAAAKLRFTDPDQRRTCGNGVRGKPWSAARRAAHESRG
jgi:hypothetical protein